MFAYAARNAILPSVTGFAIALGTVVGGQLLVEIVFSYPGIGFALFQAIQRQDYALADGILLLVIVATVFMNLIVDLALHHPRSACARGKERVSMSQVPSVPAPQTSPASLEPRDQLPPALVPDVQAIMRRIHGARRSPPSRAPCGAR